MRFIFSSVIGLLLSSGAGAQAVLTSAAWVAVKQQALWYGLAPVGFALVVGLGWLVNRYVRSSRTSVAAPLLRFGEKPLWWAVVVLVIGLAGNAWLVQRAQDQIYTSALFRFQQQVEHLDADIQSRLEKVGGILNDMRATVVTHDDLSRVAFRDWVMARQLGQEFSGVRGFGLIDRVARSDIPAFVARQRSTGAPTFAVHSAGDATDLFVVKYVEPLDTNLAAQGFDVGSEAVLRVAAERAMLEGHPALTGRISLVQDAASRPGFLLYVPIFKKSEMPSTIEQRVRAFRGWAYAPIVAASFFEPTLAATQDLVDFQLFDGLSVSAETLVYDSDFPMGVMAAGTVGSHPDALFSQLLPTVLGGGVFQLLVTSTPNFERTVELDGPANSALVGSVLSLLAGFSVWLLMVGRERSEALARAMSQDLTREKERTQSILSGTNVGTWEWNVITKEFKVNERFVTMMGFTMDEVLPDVWSFWKGRTHLDDWARATNTQVMLLRGQQPLYSCDTRVLRKDGEWMWVLSRGQVMTRTPDGRVEWLGGIHTDITDAKRHEENLRDAEAFLERAGRHAGFGAWQVNLKTNEILWNDQTCEIHGVEAGFRPTMEQAIAFYPGDAARQMQVAIEKAVTQGLGWDLITPFVNAEGEARWVRSVGEVEFDDSGAVRLLGALQDVTNAHKSQLALEQATEQAQSVSTTLQSVLDSAVDVAVIATDLTQIITVFNKGAERLLGYSADEVVGKLTSASFFAAEQLKVVRESLALLLGREPTDQEVFNDVVSSAQQSEWAFVRKDRSRVNVSLVISPMRNVAGEMVGHLGIAQDITRQQAYEDSLRHAKQAAEQSSLAKSQFLANMSHEIRTPMNAILGMLKLLQNTPLSVRQSDYATKTESAAKSLLMLLNDILDFSKVEAGKLEMDPEPFKVDQLLSDLSVILSANLGSKSLDVLFDVDPRIPPSLVGDALRIKQILINLGGNAIKFTAKGQVVVQWRLLHLQDARAQVEITVRDTGIGIALENQSRIFEGFSQAEASTTRKFGGTGLGLVISQRLIALMGGGIGADQCGGGGQQFQFCVGSAGGAGRSEAHSGQQHKCAVGGRQPGGVGHRRYADGVVGLAGSSGQLGGGRPEPCAPVSAW